MNMTIGSGIQNIGSPLMLGGKVAGNAGMPKEGEGSFFSALQDAVNNVENLNKQKDADSYALAVGDVDDIAQVMVSSQKAEVAFQLLVQVRNKVLDSYSEIMRMNV